jgi:ribonucleoside-triphosphate reductase
MVRNEWNGAFILHNAPTSSIKPYCFAYDLDQLVEKGLYFINTFKATAAKHLTTFNEHVLDL